MPEVGSMSRLRSGIHPMPEDRALDHFDEVHIVQKTGH